MAGKAAGGARRSKRPVKARASSQDFVSDGPRVAAWLKAYVRHTKGVHAGQPLELEAWQTDFVNELYRLDADGKRVYTNCMLLLPRKNGKSTLAAGLALYQLCADGESSPEVYLSANSREQAGAVFRQMRDCVLTSPMLGDWVTPMRSHLECPSNMGIARVTSADGSKSVHGTNPSFACQDELWAAKSMDLLEALVSGAGARSEPLTVIISTVGHDRSSPLGEMHKKLYQLPEELRETRNDGFLTIGRDLKAGFLYWCYGPPLDPADWRYTADLDDPTVWRKANPASWITNDFLAKQHASPSMRQSEFQRFMVNAWAESLDYWLPQGAWSNGRDGFVPIEDGATVTLGVDLGLRRDRSSVVLIRRREVNGEMHFDVMARVWEPPVAEGVNFDVNELREYIKDCCRRFDVERVGFDPWRLSETSDALLDDGIPMTSFSMGWERSAPASEALYDAIVSGRMHHDGDPVLAAHVAAGATTTSERGWRITKRKATEPVDGLIALMIAHSECMAAIGQGANSIYEQRDLITL